MKYVLKLEKNIKLNEFNKKTKLNLKKTSGKENYYQRKFSKLTTLIDLRVSCSHILHMSHDLFHS